MKIKKKKSIFILCSVLNKNMRFLFEKVKKYQYFATNIFSEKCDTFLAFLAKQLEGQSWNIPQREFICFEEKKLEN